MNNEDHSNLNIKSVKNMKKKWQKKVVQFFQGHQTTTRALI